MPHLFEDVIELRAISPDGQLACDISIATPAARAGLSDDLADFIRRPLRPLPNGVEVHFDPDGFDVVLRYVELESRCCSFLSLRLQRTDVDVVLTVTGRPEAKNWIDQIFA